METLDLDLRSEGFWRHRCPDCRRRFRLRPRAQERNSLAREALLQLPQANLDELAADAHPSGRCPYCGRINPVGAFLEPEQERYLEAAGSWLSAEVQYEQLRWLQSTLGQNPYLTFIAIRPERPRVPRPASGDLRIVPLYCCGETIGLDPDWKGDVQCPYCTSP